MKTARLQEESVLFEKKDKKLLHIGIELRQHRGLISKKFVGAPFADPRG